MCETKHSCLSLMINITGTNEAHHIDKNPNGFIMIICNHDDSHSQTD